MNKRSLVVLCVAVFATVGAIQAMGNFADQVAQARLDIRNGDFAKAEALLAQPAPTKKLASSLELVRKELDEAKASRGAMAAAGASGTPVAPAIPAARRTPKKVRFADTPESTAIEEFLPTPAAIPVPVAVPVAAPVVLSNSRRQAVEVGEAARRGIAPTLLEEIRATAEARALANLEAEAGRASSSTQTQFRRLTELFSQAKAELNQQRRFNLCLQALSLYEFLVSSANFSNQSLKTEILAEAVQAGRLSGYANQYVQDQIEVSAALGRQGIIE